MYQLVSVELNGLGKFLEQSKWYTLTAFGQLNLAVEDSALDMVVHLEKTGRTLVWCPYNLQHGEQY